MMAAVLVGISIPWPLQIGLTLVLMAGVLLVTIAVYVLLVAYLDREVSRGDG